MMYDPKNIKAEDEVHKITEGNNSNDDEEILKNTDEPINQPVDNDAENKAERNKEQSESSETIGIP